MRPACCAATAATLVSQPCCISSGRLRTATVVGDKVVDGATVVGASVVVAATVVVVLATVVVVVGATVVDATVVVLAIVVVGATVVGGTAVVVLRATVVVGETVAGRKTRCTETGSEDTSDFRNRLKETAPGETTEIHDHASALPRPVNWRTASWGLIGCAADADVDADATGKPWVPTPRIIAPRAAVLAARLFFFATPTPSKNHPRRGWSERPIGVVLARLKRAPFKLRSGSQPL